MNSIILIYKALLFPLAVLAVKNSFNEQSQSGPVTTNWQQLFCLGNREFYAPIFDTSHCSHVYRTFLEWLEKQDLDLHFSEDAGPNEISLPQVFRHGTCTMAITGLDRLWQERKYLPNSEKISPGMLWPGLRAWAPTLIRNVEDILGHCLSQNLVGMQLLWNTREGYRNVGVGLFFYVTGSSADNLIKQEQQQKADLASFLGHVFPPDHPRDRSKDLLPEFQDALDQVSKSVPKKARHRR